MKSGARPLGPCSLALARRTTYRWQPLAHARSFTGYDAEWRTDMHREDSRCQEFLCLSQSEISSRTYGAVARSQGAKTHPMIPS